jgi:hypothetical protein
MKHQIDTMTSINNLVKDYENTIGVLRIQNEQLRIDLEELRASYFKILSELIKKNRKKNK